MSSDTHYFEFAIVMDVQPADAEVRWESALKSATPPAGIKMMVRRPTLALFTVEDVTEWGAIDRVAVWLKSLADDLTPPVTVGVNAQPSSEV